MTSVSVFNEEAIAHKMRRMAWEIVENNFGEETVCIVGINQRGFVLADDLHRKLKEMAPFSVLLLNTRVTKGGVYWYDAHQQLTDKREVLKHASKFSVLFVDDVLNTGQTLLRGIAELVPFAPKKIEIATLVERSHKRYPLTANYKGCQLSTTLNDHVRVRLGKTKGVYLQQVVN